MSEMRNYKKTGIFLSIILALSVIASGCSGEKVISPQDIECFMKNNIEIENVEDTDQEDQYDYEFAGDYVKISGLKDKRIEDKVNEEIYNVYLDIKNNNDLSPYRGVKQKINGDYEITSKYIWSFVSANVNNILSLYVNESICYENNLGDIYYSTDIETVNLDLNTGEEIALADVFCDDVDYEAVLNEYIAEAAISSGDNENGYYDFSEENQIKFTAPFEGIKEGQKYYINEYDGSIQLVFDYEQPEVYCEYDSPVFFRVDLGENSALAQRYYDSETSIYEGETENAVILKKSFETSEAVTKDEAVSISGENGELQIWITSIYYNDMPAGALRYAKKHAEPTAKMIETYKNTLKEYDELYSESGLSSDAFYYMDCSKFGEFTNVETRFGVTFYSEEVGLPSMDQNNFSCFRAAEYQPLDLEDIFVSDVDIKKIVIEAFMKNTELEDGSMPSQVEKSDLESFFNEAYDRINGFAIMGNFLMFSYDNLQELLEKYFEGEDMYLYQSFCESAEYEDLGINNLSIF